MSIGYGIFDAHFRLVETMAKTRAELLAEQRKHEAALKEASDALNALDEQEASKTYEKIVELIGQSGKHFTLIQRNHIARLVKPNSTEKPGSKEATHVKEWKYQLDSGKKWMGSGRRPPEFVEWAEKNPNKQYPAYPNPKAKNA